MDERCHSTSAPAQKLGPSPESTTALASPTSANASASSPIRAASNALRRSGRASVTRRISPSRSVRSALTSGVKLLDQGLDLAEHVRLLVAEVVEVGVQGVLQQAQLFLRQLDRVHGGTLRSGSAGVVGARRAAG